MHRSVQASIGNSKGANSRLSAVVVKFSFVLSYAPPHPPPSFSLSLYLAPKAFLDFDFDVSLSHRYDCNKKDFRGERHFYKTSVGVS